MAENGFKPITEELRKKLREPLPAEAIKQHPTKSYMSSINQAYITERLNDCFGENGWDARYSVVEGNPNQKMVVVKCMFAVADLGIYRENFGGNDNSDRGDAYKGACTDALGKVCSHLGIAADVYKGMHDQPAEGEAGTGRRRKSKEEKRQYESVDGMVTKYERMSPSTLWLQVNGVRLRAVDPQSIAKLKDCQGKRIEVNAFWDKVGEKGVPVMTISSVIGLFEPIPGDTQYVPLADAAPTGDGIPLEFSKPKRARA